MEEGRLWHMGEGKEVHIECGMLVYAKCQIERLAQENWGKDLAPLWVPHVSKASSTSVFYQR